MELTIRRLDAQDHARILELWRRAGLHTIRPEGRDAPEAFARQVTFGNQVVLGAVDDAAGLVGVVLVTHDERKGWIHRLAVEPARRRQGIAQQLLEGAEAWLHERGIQIFAALIESENTPSLAFFERAGYAITDGVRYARKSFEREDDSAP